MNPAVTTESDFTSVVNLETDWRALLVKKRHQHESASGPAAPQTNVSPAAEPAAPTVTVSPPALPAGIIAPISPMVEDEVHLNIVGTDGPPSTSSSVTEEPEVRPTVEFN